MHRPSSLSRRSLLAGAGLGLALASSACESDRATTSAETPRDPDRGLLDGVTTASWELHARSGVAQSAAGSGRTAQALGALTACLASHLRELDPDEESRPQATPSPQPGTTAGEAPANGEESAPDESPRALARGVLQAARAHVTLLEDGAARAESGAFARLLASASAGVQQHLVALERRVEKRTEDQA